MGGAAYSYSYPYFFRTLINEGGANVWLARAISILFAAAVAQGVSMVFSIKSRRRNIGWVVLLVSWVGFNVLVYACTQSTHANDDRLVGTAGEVTTYYYITSDGRWKLFQHAAYTPDGKNFGPHGEDIKPLTPEAAREYDAWLRHEEVRERKQRATEQAENEKQTKAATDRRFRETYVSDAVVSPPVIVADRVFLAVKIDPPDAQGDVLQGLLADQVAKKNKRPVSGAFKPAFYATSPFEDVWNGDRSILDRLRFFDGASVCVLLCKANLSGTPKSGFEGIVSVQGTLSLVLVKKDGRSGPWVFNASGAGSDRASAAASCAKRLAESVDIDSVFRN